MQDTQRVVVNLLHNLITLQTMSSLLGDTVSLEEVAQRSLDIVAESVGATFGVLRLYEESADRYRVIAVYGQVPAVVQKIPSWDLLPPQPGVINLVALSESTVLIPDIRELPLPEETHRILEEASARSCAGIPLRAGNKLIGTLILYHPEPNHFSTSLKPLLDVLGTQVALALENCRLKREVMGRMEHLQRVLRMSEIATSTLELEALLRRFANALVEHLNVTECYIVLYDVERDILIPAAASDPYHDTYRALRPRVTRDTPSLTRHVLETKRPEVVVDVFSSPWISPDIARRFPTKSLLAVPMIMGDVPLGAVLVGERRHQRRFTDAEVHEVSVLARQIAMAIRHAQIHEQVRQQAADLQLLYDLAAALIHLHSAREMAEVAVQVLDRRFPEAYIDIFLLNWHTGQLELLAINERGRPYIPKLYANVIRYEQGEGLIGQAYVTGNVIRVDDVRTAPHFVEMFPDVRSEMCVPLTIHDQVVGVINLESPYEARFALRDEQLVRTLATTLAAGLENVRLYEELEESFRQQKQAYEQLLVQDRHKDEFIQNLTHEMRNALTFVKGYTELLNEGVLGDLNEEQSRALEVVARRTEDLVSLITDVLELHRGDLEHFSVEPVDLAAILHMCAESALPTILEHDLKLEVQVPETLPAVLGNARRLRQVFDNLLSNAIKFSPPGRSITIRAWAEDGEVVAAVADQGVGIPPEDRERIFERFFQTQEGKRRRGAGVGLAISKRIIEVHGGRIWVESEVGKGSTFYVALPKAPTEVPDEADESG